MTTDLKANNYILFNSYDYQKIRAVNYIFRQIFGNGTFPHINCGTSSLMTLFCIGLVVVEGDVHKHQVRLKMRSQTIV